MDEKTVDTELTTADMKSFGGFKRFGLSGAATLKINNGDVKVVQYVEVSDESVDRIAKAVANELSSAQPEIIRCKDCKYQVKEWRVDKRLKDNGYWVYGCEMISDVCGYWALFGQDDEFCSDAERRTDGVDS